MGKTLDYVKLKKDYQGFVYPETRITLNGKNFNENKDGIIIVSTVIELTSGFEASIATLKMQYVFDMEKGNYRIEDIKKYILLGGSVVIELGYSGRLLSVFSGFVAQVRFIYEEDMPYLEVMAMDIKGMMMANHYACQLKAKSYGEAVREILERASYEKLKSSGIISELKISDTPDKNKQGGEKASSETIEMVVESDYDFVVKAAKRFHYEFFTEGNVVYFRKAKSDEGLLISLGSKNGILGFDIGYSISGLVESVEVRAIDVGTGKVISAKAKRDGDISLGSKAKALLGKSMKVHVDNTIFTEEQAKQKLEYLMDEMSYRFGTIECECIGIPELVPGRFVEIRDLGSPAANRFYVTEVIHSIDAGGYRSKIIGKAAKIQSG